MKTGLTKGQILGLVWLPILFSCSTIEQKAPVNTNEQLEDVVTTETPVFTDYGKLVRITVSTDILFDSGNAKLKMNDIQPLNSFAKELQNLQTNLLVIVHTDRIGSVELNKELTLLRAEAIKIHLISKGIVPNRIFVEGRGEGHSVTGDTCAESMERATLIDCLSPDRRVEINVEVIRDHVNDRQPTRVLTTSKTVAENDGELTSPLPDILFNINSTRIKPNDLQLLDSLAKELKDVQGRIVVTGYTDQLGSKTNNYKLSLKRAEVVKAHLISRGVRRSRIITVGKGEESPITSNTCGTNMKRKALVACLSSDRRVTIEITNI